MGKITKALQKAAEERFNHTRQGLKIQGARQLIVRKLQGL